MTTIKFKPQMIKLKQSLDAAKQIEEQQKDQEDTFLSDPLLDPNDAVDSMIAEFDRPPILQKIDKIEQLISQETLPVATLKSACRTVMLSLKESPELVLELEPDNIATIIAGYKAVANKEVMAILDKKKKTPAKKPTISQGAKEILAMAKEGPTVNSDMDLDFL